MNAEHPWDERKGAAFGRFSLFYRHLHPNDTGCYRRGAGGQDICRDNRYVSEACHQASALRPARYRAGHMVLGVCRDGPHM